MCTVTVIQTANGIRLACNRDERRTRVAALRPIVQLVGGRSAIYPLDPEGGGTWIGVNDAGVAMSLLNFNPLDRTKAGPVSGIRVPTSRGRIIPSLLNARFATHAADAVAQLSLLEYQPFRLVIADERICVEAVWNGGSLAIEKYPIGKALMFTSSGLGDALVEPPRRKLFEKIFESDDDHAKQQDAFHKHQWPEAKHLSICMEREDARTVSYTMIRVEEKKAAMAYWPQSPDVVSTPSRVELARK